MEWQPFEIIRRIGKTCNATDWLTIVDKSFKGNFSNLLARQTLCNIYRSKNIQKYDPDMNTWNVRS